MLAIDISNYTGYINDSIAQCWKEQGVTKVIVGTQNTPIARNHFTVLSRNGLICEAYVYLYWDRDVIYDVGVLTKNAIEGFPVQRLWIDVEDSMVGHTQAHVIEQIDKAIRIAEGLDIAVGIYSGKWWWDANFSNVGLWSHLPLWTAQYDGQANLQAGLYGGWTKLTMKQYQGTTTLCGNSALDLNYYEEEEDVATIQDILNRMDVQDGFISSHGSYLADFGDRISRLEEALDAIRGQINELEGLEWDDLINRVVEAINRRLDE